MYACIGREVRYLATLFKTCTELYCKRKQSTDMKGCKELREGRSRIRRGLRKLGICWDWWISVEGEESFNQCLSQGELYSSRELESQEERSLRQLRDSR